MNLVHDAGMQRLPPFDALVAFESAARLGGMTRAAGELGLTQSAISHRIRRLEDFMGTALFVRANAGLALTAPGQALLDGFLEVLDSTAELKTRCLSAAAPDRLRVGVGAALADNWLVRRLPDFRARHPGIAIELSVIENEAPERIANVDLRILWVSASDARPSSTQRALFREHVFPVCAPSLLPKRHDESVLLRLPLLHKHAAHQGEEWSWAGWFARLGLRARPAEALRFAAIGPAIAAAISGAGVALARSMLVHDALADGCLVRVLSPEMDQLSAKVHIVRWPGRLATDRRVLAFASWLVEASSFPRRRKVPDGRSGAADGPAGDVEDERMRPSSTLPIRRAARATFPRRGKVRARRGRPT